MNGTRVLIGEVASPLFFVSSAQINAQVPFEVPPGLTKLTVEYPGPAGPIVSNSIDVLIAAAAPGIFTLPAGNSIGLFLKPDLSVVTAQNPAKRGSVVQFYATGLGAVNPAIPSGSAAPDKAPFALTATAPLVNVGGFDATVEFSGLAPGYAGLYQINIRIPQTVAPGRTFP